MSRVYRHAYYLLIGVSVVMGGLALVTAQILDQTIIDPDGFLGPSQVRLPLLVGAALLADMIPQYLWVGRAHPKAGWVAVKNRWRTHWTKERLILVIGGIVSFYITYVSYRNLKSFLPTIMGMEPGDKYDRELHILDRAMFFGMEPATVMHAVFGTGPAAYFLSTIYLWFLPMVPIGVTVYLVWSRNLRFGYWFVCSQVLIWSLGTASYYALPTLGPGFRYPWLYADLPNTGTTSLMDALFYGRKGVVHDGVEGAVQSVAGFASLHTGVTLLLALMIQYTIRNRVVKILAWANFAVTVVATMYFGWHYVADVIGGVAIALVSFYWGGLAAGQKFTKDALRHAQTSLAEGDDTAPAAQAEGHANPSGAALPSSGSATD